MALYCLLLFMCSSMTHIPSITVTLPKDYPLVCSQNHSY